METKLTARELALRLVEYLKALGGPQDSWTAFKQKHGYGGIEVDKQILERHAASIAALADPESQEPMADAVEWLYDSVQRAWCDDIHLKDKDSREAWCIDDIRRHPHPDTIKLRNLERLWRELCEKCGTPVAEQSSEILDIVIAVGMYFDAIREERDSLRRELEVVKGLIAGINTTLDSVVDKGLTQNRVAEVARELISIREELSNMRHTDAIQDRQALSRKLETLSKNYEHLSLTHQRELAELETLRKQTTTTVAPSQPPIFPADNDPFVKEQRERCEQLERNSTYYQKECESLRIALENTKRDADKAEAELAAAKQRIAAIREAIKPIGDWYESDGEERPLEDIIRDAVVDAMNDRTELLRLRQQQQVEQADEFEPNFPPPKVTATYRCDKQPAESAGK